MTKYKIEAGIPIAGIKQPTWPFEKLGLGESFYLSADDPGSYCTKNQTSPRVFVKAAFWGKANGRRFTCRKQYDGGYRLWRTR